MTAASLPANPLPPQIQPPVNPQVPPIGTANGAAQQLSPQDVSIVSLARKALANRTADKFKDADLNEMIGQIMQMNIKMPNLKRLLHNQIGREGAKSLIDVLEPQIKDIRSRQREEVAMMMAGIIAGIAIMVIGIIATSTGYGAFVGVPLIVMGLLLTLYIAKPVALPIAKTALNGVKVIFSKIAHLKLWQKFKRKKRLRKRSSVPTPVPTPANARPSPAANPNPTAPVATQAPAAAPAQPPVIPQAATNPADANPTPATPVLSTPAQQQPDPALTAQPTS